MLVMSGAAVAAQSAAVPPAPKPAQQSAAVPPAGKTPATGVSTVAPGPVTPGVTPPPGYVIGPDDVLAVIFWRDKEISSEVSVRPDGKISLPLLNDVQAAGLTPEQLRDQLMKAAATFIADPNATVVVRQINSRKVFITGNVNKPGAYSLTTPTNVLQLIATAGGLLEYADASKILIMRTENGRPVALRFNYKDVSKGKNPKQNIELKPGDIIVVP
jgi:polysaccharide export outer membrane protein